MTLRLTNSEMSTWRRCERKWYWESYRGLRKREVLPAGTPLAIGSRVHVALAAFYSGGSATDALAESIARDLATFPEHEAQILKDQDLCSAMIEGYLEWLEETGVDADLRVIAAETKLEVPITFGVTLLSKLDARVERHRAGTPTRMALEFKTVGDLTSSLPTLALDTQLLTEHLVEFLHLRERGQEGDRAQGVLYRMLRKVKRTDRAKPPFYSEEEVPHSVEELRNHWRHVVAYAGQIQAARARLDAGETHHSVTPPSPQSSCSWYCPLLGACKLANAGADVEGYLSDHFEVRDPLERYAGIGQVDL